MNVNTMHMYFCQQLWSFVNPHSLQLNVKNQDKGYVVNVETIAHRKKTLPYPKLLVAL